MAENNKGTHILHTFITSGLHQIIDGPKADWPPKTVGVCLIEYLTDKDNPQHTVIRWNIPKMDANPAIHAEERLIEDIENDKGPTKIKSITIYINYSPCTECGSMLMKLKKKFPNIQIKVVFSALYKQKRPSCERSDILCTCWRKDRDAFTMLMKLDARPVQKEDWNDLINLLRKNDEREEHSSSGLDDLRIGDEYKVWRNGEDERLTEDYEEMSKDVSEEISEGTSKETSEEMSEEMSTNTPSTPSKKTSCTGEHSRPSKRQQETDSIDDRKPRKKLFKSKKD